MLITGNKDECVSVPNTFVLGLSLTDKTCDRKRNEIKMSGKVILMIAIQTQCNSSNVNNVVWDNSLYDRLKRCKPDVLKSYDHHGSQGSCFSFGNKPYYKIVNNSSVGVYSVLKRENKETQRKIDKEAKEMEHICSITITDAIQALGRILPQIRNLISPVLDVAHLMQKKKKQIGLMEIETSGIGCWNAFLYANGRTDNLHTEVDCAYTLITVPNQKRKQNTKLDNKPLFVFKLSEKQQILFPLSNGLSFVYNGRFVMHRQAYYPDEEDSKNVFYNLSSYGNEKIFNHLRKTFERQSNI